MVPPGSNYFVQARHGTMTPIIGKAARTLFSRFRAFLNMNQEFFKPQEICGRVFLKTAPEAKIHDFRPCNRFNKIQPPKKVPRFSHPSHSKGKIWVFPKKP